MARVRRAGVIAGICPLGAHRLTRAPSAAIPIAEVIGGDTPLSPHPSRPLSTRYEKTCRAPQRTYLLGLRGAGR